MGNITTENQNNIQMGIPLILRIFGGRALSFAEAIYKRIGIRGCVIVGLVVYIMLMKMCAGTGGECPEYEEKTVTIYTTDTIQGDSVLVEVEIEKPVPRETIRTVRDTVLQKVDSNAIVAQYFTRNFYNDTIMNPDSNVVVVLIEEVTQNELASRDVFIQNLKETSIENTTTTHTTIVTNPSRNKFYLVQSVNFYVGADPGERALDGATGIAFIPKNNRYILGAKYVWGEKMVSGSFGWKISFRKNQNNQ